MDENKNIENKIKKSFDVLNKQAPDSLWNSLSDKLPVSEVDKNIEVKIKNSFGNLNHAAPSHIWGTVNKQLNIDKVWNKISEELDRRSIVYRRNIASLAILFLLFLCGIIYLYNPKKYIVSYYHDHPNQQQNRNTTENNLGYDAKRNQTNKTGKTIYKEKGFIKATDAENSIKQTTSQKSIVNKNNQKIVSIPKYKTNSNTTPVTIRKTKSDIKTKEPYQSNNPLYSNPDVYNKDFYQLSDDSSLIVYIIPLKDLFIGDNNSENELILSKVTCFNNTLQDTLSKNPLSLKRKKFEVGVTYSYNNTWIINNETRKSFDENSLIKTSPAFGSSYGLIANYNISKSSAITTEVYINSKYRQQYGAFIEGKYSIHTITFNYAKLCLLYQLNIHQSSYRKIPSKFTFKAGFYGSYLKNYNHTYSKIVVAETDKYTTNDYGIKLAIGQEKKFGNIILGFGANAEYGLKNNFAGNKQMPAGFNVTKNALMGAYLNLKYNF